MSSPLNLLILGLAGFLGILGTRPIIVRMPRAWRWSWGILLLAIYYLVHGLLQRYRDDYYGSYGFFSFLAGAILANVLYSIIGKPTNQEKPNKPDAGNGMGPRRQSEHH